MQDESDQLLFSVCENFSQDLEKVLVEFLAEKVSKYEADYQTDLKYLQSIDNLTKSFGLHTLNLKNLSERVYDKVNEKKVSKIE